MEQEDFMKGKALKNNFHSRIGERMSYGLYFLGQRKNDIYMTDRRSNNESYTV
jgi:hypothetical protein